MSDLDFSYNITELWKGNRRGWGFYLGDTRLPVTPETLKISIKNNNKTISLINEGEVNILKTAGLSEVSFGVLLPNQLYPFALYNKGFQKAEYYLSKLEHFKNCGKPVTMRIIRYVENSFELLYDTEMKVSVEDYVVVEDSSKYGSDTYVDIKLKQYRTFVGKTITVNTETKTATEETAREKESYTYPAEYTVKEGDTLSAISKQIYDWEEFWKNIYELNKDLIESEAKKHGLESSSNGLHIYAGTVLKIPQEVK